MHIIGDTCRKTSIKSSEREKRESSSKSCSKVSKYYGTSKVSQKFLQSGCNKTRLI